METYSSLEKLFKPQSVALIGASEDIQKLSGQPLRNLLKVGFKGNIYPVNPRIDSIDGIKCYKSVRDIGQPVDVAMICLPAEVAVAAVEDCLNLNIPTAIVAVSGFGEVNTEKGKELQQKLAELAEKGIRIVGPNCNGIYNVHDRISIGYNVTHSMLLDKGSIAVLSHSGALFSSIVALGSIYGEGIGFSYFVSAGNEVDLNLLDYMEYMIRDSHTKIIAMILDGVHNPEKFRQLSQEARAKGKYLVALKLGKSETGVQATLAHSSRLSGSARSYTALFRQCGVIQVDSIESLVGVCAVLEKYNLTGKNGLAGVSTSGAGCVLMADTVEQYGMNFPALSSSTIELMDKKKGFGTPMNPYDIGASGSASIGYIAESIAKDEQVGFMLFYSTILQTPEKRKFVASEYARVCKEFNKMPFVVIAPGPLSPEEMAVYKENDIVVFNNTDTVFQVLKAINDSAEDNSMDVTEAGAGQILSMEGESELLNYDELSRILNRLDIPQPKQLYVEKVDQLADACHQIGYPLVIKGISNENTHKSDLGLVWTDVISDSDVSEITRSLQHFTTQGIAIDGVLIQEFVKGEAEVLIGLNKDPDVGYVLVIGSGGKYAEIYDDIETCIIPTSRENIRRTLLKTKVGQILSGARNNGLNPEQIVDIAYRLQGIVGMEGISIESLDLNPIIVNREKATAVDVRIMHV